VGIYIVRDGFTQNFGRQLLWWATVLVGLAALVVAELVVQALRRVYWPNDQDLMQRIEKDALAQGKLRDRAQAAERGEAEGIELRDLIAESEQEARERKMREKHARGRVFGRMKRRQGEGLAAISGEGEDAVEDGRQTDRNVP
jgi:phospholipid-translocating ATPase